MVPSAAIVIPFRDRGNDPARPANLRRVEQHWCHCDIPVLVVSDGLTGVELFNRSAAYNYGAAATDADVLVYIEADIIIDLAQLQKAIHLAADHPGLVLPFTHLHALDERDSADVRAHQKQPSGCSGTVSEQSVGPANVVSRRTLEMVGGWDEAFRGHGFDDLAMCQAFEVVAGPLRRVSGPAYHLHHLPGVPGPRNFDRAQLYGSWCSAEEIRRLTRGQEITGWPDWTEAAYL